MREARPKQYSMVWMKHPRPFTHPHHNNISPTLKIQLKNQKPDSFAHLIHCGRFLSPTGLRLTRQSAMIESYGPKRAFLMIPPRFLRQMIQTLLHGYINHTSSTLPHLLFFPPKKIPTQPARCAHRRKQSAATATWHLRKSQYANN